MKPVLYTLLTLLFVTSCKDKEVDLLPIDMLTGGTSKTWNMVAFSIDGEPFLASDLGMTDLITFEKRFSDENNLKVYQGTFYVWRSLDGGSNDFIKAITKFDNYTLHLNDVNPDGSIAPTPEVWNVEIKNKTNIILKNETINSEEFIKDENGQFVPNPFYGQKTSRILELIYQEDATEPE
ncbi:hypothetical protein Lbys_1575 [Leadbetterella byssophila DSM 17132]|uniref:Lipocalin-like domain-containing protein n=1 Tax=Leadbetterella byssophila (strain DSM 17132 / JCM 16389 / KACC 11308 / NBRC 106382 / 4M15) TaxID=649349 RepID=E4RY72_LEAB4|nr:hypothetical protein [Leadbetterella byssophila]ADQ17283.1 hypothetical protein Lbys_1575 [Leadbetterella byssophila DSM 17132]